MRLCFCKSAFVDPAINRRSLAGYSNKLIRMLSLAESINSGNSGLSPYALLADEGSRVAVMDVPVVADDVAHLGSPLTGDLYDLSDANQIRV